MSSQASEQSPLDKATAEADELYQKLHRDLDSLRTAPINEFGNRIDSLQQSVKLIQDSARTNIGKALETAKSRILDLENSEQAKQTQLEHVQKSLRSESAQAASFRMGSLVRQQEADAKLHTVKSALETAEEEVFRLGRQSATVREVFDAAKQQNIDLKADLKATKERALAAENERDALQSRLMQINNISALVSSSRRQPNVAQPAASSAPSPIEQASVDESRDGSPQQDHHARAENLDPHPGNAMSDPEFDLLLCQTVLDEVKDKKYWHHNQHFLNPVDSAAPNVHSRLGAITHPMDLNVMTEKLAAGSYTSVNSFKADFNLMIADRTRLNPPDSHVRIAAERLAKIFEQAWSATHISGRGSPGSTNSTQGASNKKRKAGPESLVPSEDGHVQKRPSLAPPEQDINHVQPVNPNGSESLSVASPSSDQPRDRSNDHGKDDTYAMKGRLTAGTRLGIEANLDVMPKFVSVTKSPNTLPGGWELLVPNEYRLTAHAVPSTVEKRLEEVASDLGSDVVIIRLVPASDADKPEFDRILKYFLDKERFATVSHAGTDSIKDIYLIPASKDAPYPRSLSPLDTKLLPRAKTEDVLFMAITFRLGVDKHTEIRQAWDGLIKAIQNPNLEGLAAMHEHLVCHQLPVFGPRLFAVSRHDHHTRMHNRWPLSQDFLDSRLLGISRDILRLSDSNPNQILRPMVDGVKLPECVFVLGRECRGLSSRGLFVIDIQHRDRPLWLISFRFKPRARICRITLVRNKSPGSLDEWEGTLTTELREKLFKTSLQIETLKLERYTLPA